MKDYMNWINILVWWFNINGFYYLLTKVTENSLDLFALTSFGFVAWLAICYIIIFVKTSYHVLLTVKEGEDGD